MSVNRYTEVNYNTPMSSYVPLPLDTLNAVGATMQQNYDKDVDIAYKTGDLINAIPTIQDSRLGLDNSGIKKVIDNKYHDKITNLTDRVIQGDISATRELSKLQRDFQNDPNVKKAFTSYNNYKSMKEDMVKKGSKYADYLNPYMNQKLFDESTGQLTEFNYSGMEDREDHQKLSDDMMKDLVGSSTEFKNAGLGNDGILRTNFGKGEAITPEWVKKVSGSKVNDFLGNIAGNQYLQQMKYENPNVSPEELQAMVGNKLFHSGMNQIYNKVSKGNDLDVTGLATQKQARAYDKQDELDLLLGSDSSIEGQTIQTLNNDKKFKETFDNGLFKMNDKGLIEYNQSALTNKNNSPYSKDELIQRSMSGQFTSKDNLDSTKPENSKDFVKLLDKMSKATGIDISNLSKDSNKQKEQIEELANAYNHVSKIRSVNLTLNGTKSAIESKIATRNSDKLTYLNENGEPLKSNPEIGAKDYIQVTNRKTDPKGNVFNQAMLIKADGTKTPINYKGHQREKNEIFNALGKLENKGLIL